MTKHNTPGLAAALAAVRAANAAVHEALARIEAATAKVSEATKAAAARNAAVEKKPVLAAILFRPRHSSSVRFVAVRVQHLCRQKCVNRFIGVSKSGVRINFRDDAASD